MSSYKVCILAAGVGRRMGAVSEHISKAILPVNHKAVISHIVEKFPVDVEIVVAVGHQKNTIIDYLALAHPDRKFTYVHVDQYMGPGTGPGYSLLQCKPSLESPFIMFAADSLVIEAVPPPDKNWFGIAPVKKTEDYCTVKIKHNLICQIDDKVKSDNKYAFIGVAGVHDYDTFFTALETDKQIKSGEIQVSNGFQKLIESGLAPVGFTWFDTGTLEHYRETNANFSGAGQAFDFSKGDEFLYFVNNRVIKFFADAETTRLRVERAAILKGLCPPVFAQKGNFYGYEKVDGQVLYHVLNSQIVRDFLQWAKRNLWKRRQLDEAGTAAFRDVCRGFYHDKTMKRVDRFYDVKGVDDGPNIINGVAVPPLRELLAQVDWDLLCTGTPSGFHGDLQFDNILVTRDSHTNLLKFVLIDWRHEFGGLTEYGDLYYDLAKLYGGMTMSYQYIKEGKMRFDMSGSSVHYNYSIANDLVEAREEYEEFLAQNGFDLHKIKLLTAMIFLNMAPLHHDPFDLLLHFKGKLMLFHALKDVARQRPPAAVAGQAPQFA